MSLDLEGGIRNALERGASLDEAIASFVNAGYPEQEVREAAQIVNPTILSMIKPGMIPKSPPKNNPKKEPKLKTPSATDVVLKKENKKNLSLILTLIIILLVLLGGLVASILYKEQLASFLRDLLGK